MLRQDNDLVSVWAESNGPQLVIAFAGLGEVGSSVCWGADYFRKAGFSFVSFVPKKPHWYPASSFQVSAEIAQFIGQYSERITYGYSMGGHAALKAGSIFGACRSVALCPQYSVDPKCDRGSSVQQVLDGRCWHAPHDVHAFRRSPHRLL